MRNRYLQLNIRLTESEARVLNRCTERSGLSKSGYIQMLINGYVPKETPPKDYDKLIRIMADVHADLVSGKHLRAAKSLHDALLLLQAEVTLPEQREDSIRPKSLF